MKFEHIHTDDRGSIQALVGAELLPAEEVTIFTTNKDYARGGCIHRESEEHICVLQGSIYFVIKGEEDLATIVLKCGQSYTIPPNTPHYFCSITDSVVMEWGPKIEEKGERDVKFRNVVDAINNRITND